jgi:hypothetical protein
LPTTEKQGFSVACATPIEEVTDNQTFQGFLGRVIWHFVSEMKTLALLVLAPCIHAQFSATNPVVLSPQITGCIGADLFSGTWKQNLTKSTYGSTRRPASPAILRIAVVPNGLTVVVDSVTPPPALSSQIHEAYAVQFDGRDYPYQKTVNPHVGSTDAVFVVSAKKIDTSTFEIDFKQPHNVVNVRKVEKHVISSDGRTQTVTITDTYAGRVFEDIIVFGFWLTFGEGGARV